MNHLLKTKKEYKNYKKTDHSRYICQNELNNTCFQYDIAYRYFHDLPRKTTSDKEIHNKPLDIPKNLKYNRCQRGQESINLMIKNLLVVLLKVKLCHTKN